MILIVGASGHLGSAVTRQLHAQGKAVRVMSRNPSALAHLQRHGVEVVLGDLRNPASLRNACQGIDQVIAAAHALNGKGGNNPHVVDDLGNRQLIDAAKTAGVNHFLFVSSQGASSESVVPFFRIKYHTEEYLRTSGLPYSIFRPAAYMELWGQMLVEPALRQGNVMVFGNGSNPVNFVAAEDVSGLISTALDDPRALNQTINIGGPEDLTINQVVTICDRLLGRQVKIRHMPVPTLRVMAVLMKLFNPTLARLIQMSVTWIRRISALSPLKRTAYSRATKPVLKNGSRTITRSRAVAYLPRLPQTKVSTQVASRKPGRRCW
jgi:NADH dehydrogenase